MQELDQIREIKSYIKNIQSFEDFQMNKPIIWNKIKDIERYYQALELEPKLKFLYAKYRKKVANYLVRTKKFNKNDFLYGTDTTYTIGSLIIQKLVENGIIEENRRIKATYRVNKEIIS